MEAKGGCSVVQQSAVTQKQDHHQDLPCGVFPGPPSSLRVSSDFVYHVAELASLLLAGACVVLMSTKLNSTYQREVDTFGALHIPSEWGTLYIFVPCLLLAMVRMVS